ncbi:hypothetical protein HPB49_020246 [Dermacentor silvarum]|uniref:Uncharacterized protein n=1 Tax=Dermacentor silvarum TaxID=543639 RepID=A0ACB8DR47_DERSI|nr:hypothetical protein HPB49_020246 [Dermacentor silvarum]
MGLETLVQAATAKHPAALVANERLQDIMGPVSIAKSVVLVSETTTWLHYTLLVSVVTLAGISLLQRLLRTRLVPTSHDVEVQRKDPKSPLHSVTTFEDLSLRPELLKGVYACGFNEPSKIKETALPLLLADRPLNMIAQSQSGTGKTAAFVLASLSRVDEKQRYAQVLILSPTYELAVHTGEVVKRMATFCTITFCYAVRGDTLSRGEKIQNHVILGTPGKIVDWALKFNFFDLSRIKVFVLDEADIMIAMHGHH